MFESFTSCCQFQRSVVHRTVNGIRNDHIRYYFTTKTVNYCFPYQVMECFLFFFNSEFLSVSCCFYIHLSVLMPCVLFNYYFSVMFCFQDFSSAFFSVLLL